MTECQHFKAGDLVPSDWFTVEGGEIKPPVFSRETAAYIDDTGDRIVNFSAQKDNEFGALVYFEGIDPAAFPKITFSPPTHFVARHYREWPS